MMDYGSSYLILFLFKLSFVMVPFCFVSLQNTSRYGSHPFRGCLGMLLTFLI